MRCWPAPKPTRTSRTWTCPSALHHFARTILAKLCSFAHLQVLKAEPSNKEALLARAKAYLQLADLDMAKRHVGEALKYDPDNEAAMAEFHKLKKLAKLQAQVRFGVFKLHFLMMQMLCYGRIP